MHENLSETELRKAIQQEVLQNLAGTEITHPVFSTPIKINRKGLKHCISRRYKNARERLLILPGAAELLAKAGFVEKEADNHTPPRPGIFMYTLQTTHKIQDKLWTVWLYVRETPNMLNFYDLGVEEAQSE